jgi:hypothetical protein
VAIFPPKPLGFPKFLPTYFIKLLIMVYNPIYFFICQVSLFIQKIWFGISHNVPAVYDGLTARIEKRVAFLGLANCGCSEPWE